MAPLDSLGHENWIKVQDDFFGYVMLLASNDSNGIVNGT